MMHGKNNLECINRKMNRQPQHLAEIYKDEEALKVNFEF